MFCPKCGLQNTDDTKFCRGCGGGLNSWLATMQAKSKGATTVDERYVELYSGALRGVLMGLGFFFIAGFAYVMSSSALIITLFALMFGITVFTTGISRWVEARGLKALRKKDDVPSLTSGQQDYIKPQRSIYDTDDLEPASVTERTTTHLKRNEEVSD